MNTPTEPLSYFKFQYSKNSSGSRFTHTNIDKLPMLYYRHAEGNNWNANDLRVTNNMEAIYKWFENYWEIKSSPNAYNNCTQYELELEQSILEAYKNLNEKWMKKLEAEFEEKFDDKLIEFLNGGVSKK